MAGEEIKPEESGLTAFEIIDLRDQKHRHEKELLEVREREVTKREQANADKKRTEARVRGFSTLVIGLLLAALLAGFGWMVWGWTTGPETPNLDHEREQQCVAEGGGWVPKDMLDDYIDDSGGLCVFPGKKLEAPAGAED